ncbi:hypothetical protein SAMN02910369_02150 [Lachnospiraceae bacterium NE2001]|nr:hypothetical protein SAMN02910369_02150 [Lachnospiraceae bacterium NE2001]
MSNMICFNHKSDNDGMKDDLNMSNGGTSMFVNILCLSGGRLAETESQKRFMVFLAEKNQNVRGLGNVGFYIVDMPWDRNYFDEDKTFMLKVIDGARHKHGWETLGYEPNEEFVAEYLDKFQKLVERMTAEDILEESLTEWLSKADENDPVRCGFPKCKIHDTYISIHGCQVCMD